MKALTAQNPTLNGQDRGFYKMNMQKVASAPIDSASIIHPNLYSGQVTFHKGRKREGGIFFLSHHAPVAGPELAQRVGQFLQG